MRHPCSDRGKQLKGKGRGGGGREAVHSAPETSSSSCPPGANPGQRGCTCWSRSEKRQMCSTRVSLAHARLRLRDNQASLPYKGKDGHKRAARLQRQADKAPSLLQVDDVAIGVAVQRLCGCGWVGLQAAGARPSGAWRRGAARNATVRSAFLFFLSSFLPLLLRLQHAPPPGTSARDRRRPFFFVESTSLAL